MPGSCHVRPDRLTKLGAQKVRKWDWKMLRQSTRQSSQNVRDGCTDIQCPKSEKWISENIETIEHIFNIVPQNRLRGLCWIYNRLFRCFSDFNVAFLHFFGHVHQWNMSETSHEMYGLRKKIRKKSKSSHTRFRTPKRIRIHCFRYAAVSTFFAWICFPDRFLRETSHDFKSIYERKMRENISEKVKKSVRKNRLNFSMWWKNVTCLRFARLSQCEKERNLRCRNGEMFFRGEKGKTYLKWGWTVRGLAGHRRCPGSALTLYIYYLCNYLNNYVCSCPIIGFAQSIMHKLCLIA